MHDEVSVSSPPPPAGGLKSKLSSRDLKNLRLGSAQVTVYIADLWFQGKSTYIYGMFRPRRMRYESMRFSESADTALCNMARQVSLDSIKQDCFS